MFEIKHGENGTIALAGRLDASQADKAREFLETIDTASVLDFKDLDYISSSGLGVLLGTQKRLNATGQGLILVNLSKHINDVFLIAGLDNIFEIK